MSNDDLLKKAVCEEYRREIEALPSTEELEEMIVVSPEFHKKMEDLFKRHKRKTWLCRLGKNIAVFLILAACSFLLLCILNEDIRATCLQWVRTMTSNGMTDYNAVPSDKINESIAGFTLEYIPEGYVLKSANMRETDGHAAYFKGEKRLDFFYMASQDSSLSVDNDNYTFSQIELENGIICDFYKGQASNNVDTLIWRNKGYTCTLSTSGINEEEIIRIANGVKAVIP